jgi:hypothetical protein
MQTEEQKTMPKKKQKNAAATLTSTNVVDAQKQLIVAMLTDAQERTGELFDKVTSSAQDGAFADVANQLKGLRAWLLKVEQEARRFDDANTPQIFDDLDDDEEERKKKGKKKRYDDDSDDDEDSY